ncbi:MAG TPA: hypothetical protein PLA43_05675 [Bryobacteraceae bacterium]|nr:hypothetical protein [Bryobacteraceae bacterium]HOQ45263.1 hypothetical protein [Bryobacteraceae bacterium]HPU71425.1 hypothetical protein [Bryobacteraceae bacterium]
MRPLAAALILLAWQAPAHGPAIRGPMLGYVFDPGAAAIRPILGIPGAATLGAPLDLGEPIVRAVISPRQDFALAVAASDSRVLAVSLPSGTAEGCECAPGPDRILFSPRGDAAALYYSAGARLRVLPRAGTARGGEFDLSLFPGELTALAVSDSGAALAAFLNESAGIVYYLESGREPGLALSLSRASALAFLPASSDALATDDVDDRLYLIRDPGGRAEVTLTAAAGDGLEKPAAVLGLEKSRALTADARGIVMTDLTAGFSSVIECGFAPGDLQPLGGSVYRLAAPSPGPLWFLDGGAPGARVFFVPPDNFAPPQEEQP